MQPHYIGIIFQIIILSLANYFGKESYDNAVWLIEHDCIDFLGGDIHCAEHITVIKDFIGSKTYRKLESKLTNLMNDTAF